MTDNKTNEVEAFEMSNGLMSDGFELAEIIDIVPFDSTFEDINETKKCRMYGNYDFSGCTNLEVIQMLTANRDIAFRRSGVRDYTGEQWDELHNGKTWKANKFDIPASPNKQVVDTVNKLKQLGWTDEQINNMIKSAK